MYNTLTMQRDKASPAVVGELRTKQQSLDSHRLISESTPAMQKTLSTQLGLYPTPSPLLELSFDAFRYVVITVQTPRCISLIHVHVCILHSLHVH